MNKHIFFDLDGTLVDSKPGIMGSLNHAIKTVFPEEDVTNLQFKIGPPVREIMRAVLGSIDESQLSLLESTFRSDYDTHGWENVKFYPGVHETLLELLQQEIKMYIITNKPSIPTMKMLSHLGVLNYFKHILSRDSNKPPFLDKAAMIKFLGKKYRIKVETAIFVGDSEEDTNAAGKCQMKFMGIEYGYGALPKMEDKIIRIQSFPDLLALI